MKKILYSVTILAVTFTIACKKSNSDLQKPLIGGGASGVDTLRGEISVNITVTRTTYLHGIVYVKPGVTLTVNAGVTIKGSPGNNNLDTVLLANNKGTLVVEKGGKLIANGTSSSPIVWTSAKNAGSRLYGDWGGIVLLGNAPIHTQTGSTTNYFDAFSSSDARNYYGGTNPADNSGSITYNVFEFGGGIESTFDHRVNGFNFCGVGNGTIFNHNEIKNSGFDGLAFFGGTVNVDHVIVFASKDDEYDFTEGYVGRMQFIIAYRTNLNDRSGSHGIETDNDANSTSFTPHTIPFIANATFVGPADSASGVGPGNYYDGEIYFRRASRLRLLNSLIIAQAQPYAIVSTPSTRPLVASTVSLSDSVLIAYNIWQSNSPNAVIASSVEVTPVSGSNDPVVLGKLLGLNNTSLAGFADFKLDAALKPQTGSPALNGGLDLSAYGFTGTTERGAVISSDPWTSTGTWISVTIN